LVSVELIEAWEDGEECELGKGLLKLGWLGRAGPGVGHRETGGAFASLLLDLDREDAHARHANAIQTNSRVNPCRPIHVDRNARAPLKPGHTRFRCQHRTLGDRSPQDKFSRAKRLVLGVLDGFLGAIRCIFSAMYLLKTPSLPYRRRTRVALPSFESFRRRRMEAFCQYT